MVNNRVEVSERHNQFPPIMNNTVLPDSEERIAFIERVDRFVESQRQKQRRLENESRRANITIAELAQKAKNLPPDIVDSIFSKHNYQNQIEEEVVDEVRKSLHSMRLRINALEAKKRYFVLETMDFFRSKIGIGKLIPALLLLKGDDKKKAILEFVIPTFLSINKNVETLVSTDELFTSKTVHLNRGSLYSFVADIAKILLPLFTKQCLDQYPNIISPIELITKIIQVERGGSGIRGRHLYSKMIDDEEVIRRIILDFIVSIQSHDALFNYSLKRHGYYKLFLARLTSENRFEEVEPFVASKILAGCLVGNDQRKPDDSLIDAMIHQKKYNAPVTTTAKKKFFNTLAPPTVFKLISQFKIHLQQLTKKKIERGFEEVQELAVKSVLKRVWTGFSKLADGGLSMITGPIEIIVDQIKLTLSSFAKEEREEEEKTKRSSEKPVVPVISKRAESIDFLKRRYAIVETDIIGFRGEFEGASQKDFAYNSRFFKKGEITLLEFNLCFQRLFNHLKKNKKVREIFFKEQEGIKEYYVAFLFDNRLITIGLTHVRTKESGRIQQKDLFPYIILFSESTERKKGRVLSREVIHQGRKKVFNEEILGVDNAEFFYKSVLYILHLLPEEDWASSVSQSCVKFLIKELRKLSDINK